MIATHPGSLGRIACFVTGFVILVLEMAAFRVLAPAFGMSIHVTGIVINTILLGLAIGYVLGGQAADRYGSERLPYAVIVACAVYLVAVILAYSSLLRFLATSRPLVGVAAATCLMFFPPMVLLGFVPPYFVRLLSRWDTLGRTTGRIYALSTLGSICGGVAATFLLIPGLGSRRTLAVAIGLLLAQGAVGLVRSLVAALPAAMLAIPLVLLPTTHSAGYVHQEESEYNVITVSELNGRRYLKLNGGFGYHSLTLDPKTWMSGDYYDALLFPQMLQEARDTLILGNGGGTSMTQTSHFFASRIDGVEIDPRLSALGQSHFGLRLVDRIRLIHEDARVFLHHTHRRYDVIYVDLYAGSPYVPFHVATREFYAELRRALTLSGAVAVNLPFYAEGRELNARFLRTIRSAFPDVYVFGHIAYAFASTTSRADIDARLGKRVFAPMLQELAGRVQMGLRRLEEGEPLAVFTDDDAPVEALTYAALEAGR